MNDKKDSYSARRVPFITVEWPGDDLADSEPLHEIWHSPDGKVAFEFAGDQSATNSWPENALERFLNNFAEALCQFQLEEKLREEQE